MLSTRSTQSLVGNNGHWNSTYHFNKPSLQPNHHAQPVEPMTRATASNILIRMKMCACLWTWEILGIAASLASLIILIVLVSRISDTPLQNWTFYFQPSTVVSALGVVCQITLTCSTTVCLAQLKWIYYWHSKKARKLEDLQIFDDASRGAWGAVIFLMHMWRNSVPTGLLASFVILLALGTGPAVQQIISLHSREVQSPGQEATIPISNTYNLSAMIPGNSTNSKLLLHVSPHIYFGA